MVRQRRDTAVGHLVAQAARRLFRRRVTAVAASTAAVAVVVVGGFVLRPDEQRASPAPPATTVTPDTPSAAPTPPGDPTTQDPTPIDGKVRGWPDTSSNRAGLYSWDGSSCASRWCVMGFIHNGYGSGDVTLRIERVDGTYADDGWATTTVAGHEGRYRRIGARAEEWIVEIEGSTIAVRLSTRPGTSQTELDEAHAMIGSMRTQERRTELGFRLVFRVTTDDWDSG